MMSEFQDDQKIRQMTELILGEIVFRAIHGSTEGAANVALRIFNLESRIEKAAAIERELEWARGVIQRYEMRMQEMANKIDEFEATAKARAEGREPTFAELMAHRHIATERYEEERG